MFICLCNGITDNQIRHAVRDGASSLDCLQDALGVAGQCGQCSEAAAAVLTESLASRDATRATSLFYPADSWATA
ncbi:bacterioferritin-associated ferredoxin [Chromatocurvus halotolerans]|uniref:Bacterioferritin-associated ferredoxin n=1 Tax=Chromatocurvus halotolerans TaxID=1132028 RepID=A0A4R2KU00_9GAMM|nr:bacterioferritin-associated ferredoxin [Chromatocurvus halotolerans]TCO77273.1 bacterioferritin-associated ferredoxin [Chromatocurvus halotolerans]